MKMRRRKWNGEIADGFVRGLVSTGLLAASQRSAAPDKPRRVMRLALQGGVALASAAATLAALRRDEPGRALLAVAAGAAGVAALENLLQDPDVQDA